MATKKEIDDYCKKSGYTRKQLAQAYKDAKEVNTVIQLFAEVGITWDKMTGKIMITREINRLLLGNKQHFSFKITSYDIIY